MLLKQYVKTNARLMVVIIIATTPLTITSFANAASCCGGGSASSLLLPKFYSTMLDVSFDIESYDGFWDNTGKWVEDPLGSDLNQHRLNMGYAQRLTPNWQTSVTMPFIWNQNQYASLKRNTSGVGDGTVSIWYEAFDNITCVWDVKSWKDLKPAMFFGTTLTVPTGTSPYDDVSDNFDITGRGAYRLDASMLIDKTIYPWNMTFSGSYGKYLERSVNREYGTYVEPYHKQLGDRLNTSLSFGYTYFTDKMDSLTATVAYAKLQEDKATIDGIVDNTSGLHKKSISTTLAWSTEDKSWIAKLSWAHTPQRNNWGKNFPTTDTLTIGVSHVLP